jgi:hypothetical protein
MTNTHLTPSEKIEKAIYLIRGEEGDAGPRSGAAVRSRNEGA